MIKNYLKTAWRNIIKNKFFSVINISGLALGIACSLLILLWVQDELNIDSFNSNNNLLFEVYMRQYSGNQVDGQYSTPGSLASEIKKTIPEVEFATSLAVNSQKTFQAGDKILKLDGTAAGRDLFRVFNYHLLQGTAQNALDKSTSIAISKKMAEDFFTSPQLAMGKTIRYENKNEFIVSAVFDNLPANASEKFDFLLNWDFYLKEHTWFREWENYGPSTYILLREGSNSKLVEKKMIHLLDIYNKPQQSDSRVELGLQKFDEVYLHDNFKAGKPVDGRIQYVEVFSIVAVFILLIACINFMNLSTARSIKRAKEIGVRKVIGALRSALVKQYIGESVFITAIAAIGSISLMIIILPGFNSLTEKKLSIPFGDLFFWIKLTALIVVTGAISGSYPAFFLSAFKPIQVLKSGSKISFKSGSLRKGLVVFQFVLAGLFINCSLIISRQVNYMQTKNIGYERENLIYIPLEGELTAHYAIFKNDALKTPAVQLVTRTSNTPADYARTTKGISWDDKDPQNNIDFTLVSSGYDFISTLKLILKEGRDYSRDIASDSLGYMVNESALKQIGYKDPIGKSLTVWGKKGKIIGVIKDFHFSSLQDPINPLVIMLRENESYGNILVRTQPGKTNEALKSLEKICKQLNPGFTFTYSFSDEEYKKLYQNEQVIGRLSKAFSFLAIFISCLGILGLAMFASEQRVRETSIRKILGASSTSLFNLLSKEFLLLVFFSVLIASPIAWLVMNKWLENYSYRVGIPWQIFILSGISILIIAVATVSFLSVKVALVNPMKNLRSE